MNNELQTIPINSLYGSPENSRHVFDDAAGDCSSAVKRLIS